MFYFYWLIKKLFGKVPDLHSVCVTAMIVTGLLDLTVWLEGLHTGSNSV